MSVSNWEQQLERVRSWMAAARFEGMVRPYSLREVAEQQGGIEQEYSIAMAAARDFYARLRELFAAGRSITTFGPYSPGQAVTMKRQGLEGIYLGGWATSAKGSMAEDPGADLASYPLSQVPDEAAAIVRALLTADRNQHFRRSRLSDGELKKDKPVDYRPFIIADADTGHGGDAHVRNLVRRFVEVGVPGYHIEDQKPGVKKCGHQGGKVLSPQDEQIKRLVAARFQLDVMRVAGIIVARTDAEAANLIESAADERDQAFVLGATSLDLPGYKHGMLAIHRLLNEAGIDELKGHLLYAQEPEDFEACRRWFERVGLMPTLTQAANEFKNHPETSLEALFDKVVSRYVEQWQKEAGLKTYAQAVGDVMALRREEGEHLGISPEEWQAFAARASWRAAKAKARSLGLDVSWDCELPRTTEGYYQILGGLDYAISRSLAAAPFADILWMETKTADLKEARRFAEAIHARYPDKMLAYNLSPSFNWDTTGMSEDEMREFPSELGKLGFVFNFITYGGHQIDGLAGEEFSSALIQDGMLALARLQRRLRLVESPYRTPQTHVGGPRLDAALMACSGRTATTKAMGQGSTQFQHLIQTEVPPKLLGEWLEKWRRFHGLKAGLKVELHPHVAGSDLLELNIVDDQKKKLAQVIFANFQDRRSHSILSIRDQNIFDSALQKKRLMTLVHLFMIHRYRAVTVHYVSPNDNNRYQAQKMEAQGLFAKVYDEVGDIIVADVNQQCVEALLAKDGKALQQLIEKKAR